MIAQTVAERLREQHEQEKPDIRFPEGCYGSANAPLVFVGPSPGGGNKKSKYSEREKSGGQSFWNTEFNEPFEEWNKGFRVSLRPIIEYLLDVSLKEGASKLFAFVNFDWIKNPDSASVPDSRMSEGTQDVSRMLHELRPRIIVALDYKAYWVLVELLKEEGYILRDLTNPKILVRTGSAKSFHRTAHGHLLVGRPELNGAVLLKSLQHPARIFSNDYATRVALYLKAAYQAAFDNSELNVSLK